MILRFYKDSEKKGGLLEIFSEIAMGPLNECTRPTLTVSVSAVSVSAVGFPSVLPAAEAWFPSTGSGVAASVSGPDVKDASMASKSGAQPCMASSPTMPPTIAHCAGAQRVGVQ